MSINAINLAQTNQPPQDLNAEIRDLLDQIQKLVDNYNGPNDLAKIEQLEGKLHALTVQLPKDEQGTIKGLFNKINKILKTLQDDYNHRNDPDSPRGYSRDETSIDSVLEYFSAFIDDPSIADPSKSPAEYAIQLILEMKALINDIQQTAYEEQFHVNSHDEDGRIASDVAQIQALLNEIDPRVNKKLNNFAQLGFTPSALQDFETSIDDSRTCIADWMFNGFAGCLTDLQDQIAVSLKKN